ncbi:N-acetyltransferase [Nonomuraea sp. WAC 01424]|uniref:GNAT family N-acetyltransferase n=1 Tax=Nonomuraea sp. WAC 01424 TaxID=2203200 RepID=UPI000F79DE30|nr:GNAT family N-acetyltransferase [Nonomuraea sp. WAC 01424]RSN12687.1 N-acetyltransferase [Nonomuraea sp. WAC 01424]
MRHVLTTPRLVLRPVTRDDEGALTVHWRAPDVRRFLFDGEVLPAEEIAEAIEDSVRPLAGPPGGAGDVAALWVVTEAGAGTLVGTTGLRPLDDAGTELFYSLAPEVWGKGYATEAAGAVLEFALGPLGLPEVLAEIDEGNTASAAVAGRLGMTPFDVVPGLLGPMVRYRRAAGA